LRLCVRPCDAAGWGRWPRSGFGEQALNPVDIGTHALAEFRNFYSAPIMRLKYALKKLAIFQLPKELCNTDSFLVNGCCIKVSSSVKDFPTLVPPNLGFVGLSPLLRLFYDIIQIFHLPQP
jgi:hypothetical protein